MREGNNPFEVVEIETPDGGWFAVWGVHHWTYTEELDSEGYPEVVTGRSRLTIEGITAYEGDSERRLDPSEIEAWSGAHYALLLDHVIEAEIAEAQAADEAAWEARYGMY